MILVDSYSESNGTVQIGLYDVVTMHNYVVGQSFSGNGGVLNSAKFSLMAYGSPTGSAYAKIYAHTGTFGTNSLPTGGVLATSDAFNVTGVSAASLALCTFTFSGANKITLTNTTKYVLILEYSSGTYNTKYITAGYDNAASTHGGNKCTYSTSYSWESQATHDLSFYVYKDEPPTVSTGGSLSIEGTAAYLTGTVTSYGGGIVSERGVCWATGANPTIANAKATTGSDAISVQATGLTTNTLYHYRAYVTTGDSTQYGADAIFRTIYGGNFIPFL